MPCKRMIWLFPMMLVIYETATYLANDMYLPSLPTLVKEFEITQDMAQWTMMIWFIGSASMQLVLGPISDRFGRRIVLLLSALLFVVSSYICGVTTDIQIMYSARFLQGMCVCAVAVAGYAAIHELFDTKRAIQILAIMGSVTLMAPALGPFVGAGVIYFYDWRLIFYILTAMGALSLIGLIISMPETKIEKDKLHLGKILKDYYKIISTPAFLIYSMTLCLQFMGFIIWIVESPFVILDTYQKTEIEYGLIQLIIFSQIIIGAQVTRYLVSKISPRELIKLGLLVTFVPALGMMVMNLWYKEALYPTVIWMMLISFGSAFCFGALNRGAIDTLDLPMGRRMAVLSTIMSVFAVIATVVVTQFNDATMNNLSVMIALPILGSYVLWLAGQRFLK